MALRALTRVRRGQTAKPMPFVSPVGGLNGRDALASMAPQDAIVLDNWFPSTDGVYTRKGKTAYQTALGGPVKALIPYNGPTSQKLLAFANTKVFDVTTASSPVQLATGRTSDEAQYAQFVNAGNHFIISVNGADDPISYDGTSVATLTITGVTGGQTKLFQVFTFKGRLYFAAVGQAGFYYLGVGNIQGAASYFDLGQVAMNGGSLAAICSITKDGGSGPDDYIVFIMDTGEYLVYAGYDPSSAANFVLVGRFFIAPPVGNKPAAKFGGDSVVLTDLGLVSLSRVFDGQQFNPDEDTISYKLGSALEAHIPYAGTLGWQVQLHPASNMLILNVPVGNTLGTYYQFVMNTRTNAWCRFTGWDGICWAVLGQDLFYGDYDGNVYQADNGYDDDGADIRCNAIQAYSRFDELQLKHFHNARLILSYAGTSPAISMRFNTDFKAIAPEYSAAPPVDGDSLWDVALWDVAMWGADAGTQYVQFDIGSIGFAGSTWVRTVVKGDQLRWFATEYQYEVGGLVGDE